ncbi:MAG: bifunctional glutamate N-acetyltransferase/amino-acid acetyltransferase ArgJ [Clostridiales bacterium]|nr:bifunctional glutamate N-acetyltransferase/amino-acid acetyltransferase ArgJ [Clostridiales bacterium]
MTAVKEISGGIVAAKGFKTSGIHCGLRANRAKLDLGIILAESVCSAAGTFTLNRVKAAPVYLCMEHLENGKAQAIICNSGNANACAPEGSENALRMAQAVAKATGVAVEDVLVCSTGVIGQRLNVEAVEKGVPEAVALLADTEEANDNMCKAILTTDTVKKEIAVSLTVGGKEVKIGGICKGSGMIHPNMGTMLGFVTTDCAISSEMISEALRECVRVTFNRVSVDGDTSTNDTCLVLASGKAGNREITEKNKDYEDFKNGLYAVLLHLAKAIARDGEGATKLVTCIVSGASTEDKAETLAKSVIGSSLTKAAMFGADANWGRVLCAMGYSGENFDPKNVDISFSSAAGRIKVCENGAGLPFDEELAKKILTENEVVIEALLREGSCEATAWGCDLTYDYVRINGDYRS